MITDNRGIPIAKNTYYSTPSVRDRLNDAEGYAARLREIGDQVEIREVTMYDVIVTGRCKK